MSQTNPFATWSPDRPSWSRVTEPAAPIALCGWHAEHPWDIEPSRGSSSRGDVRIVASDARLDAAFAAAFGPGSWTVTVWSVESIRCGTDVARVTRYVVRGVESHTLATLQKPLYLKAYGTRERARRVDEQLRSLSRYARTAGLDVRIASPVACVDHLNAILLEATPGRSLDVLLTTGSGCDLMDAVRQSAAALARFNQSDAPMRNRICLDDRLATLSQVKTVLGTACPELRVRIDDILKEVAGHAIDVAPRPIHGDMKPSHVLVDTDGPSFIDFDSCAAGDPLIDPARMLARLAAQAFDPADARLVRTAAAAFAREYFDRVPVAWRGRLSFAYAGALLEVAAEAVRQQDDSWRRQVWSLVEEAALAVTGPLSFAELWL